MVSRTVRLVGGVAFVAYMVYIARPGSSLFSWHPFLMSLAYSLLMTEAVFTFSKSGAGPGQLHTNKVTTHWVLLAAAGVAHIVGWAAIYFTKEANNKPHLASPHACLGCMASILLWVQLSCGIFSKYPKLLAGFVSLKRLRAGHSLSGTLAYTAGIMSIILSLGTAWYLSNAGVWTVLPALALHLMLLISAIKGHIEKYMLSHK